MRLSAENVKEAILSPDQELREAAVYYFSGSHSDDPTLMPKVIEAFERYENAAFETFSFLDDLVQTNESVAWLCRQVEQLNPDADERTSNFFTGCVAALRHADAAVLKPHDATIAGLKQLDDDSKKVIADRIYVGSFTPDALWREFTSFCEAQDQEEQAEDDDIEFGYAVADALAHYPASCAERVLAIVGQKGENWLELLAVRIAGRLRLEAAVPHLIALIEDFDTWVCEEAQDALARIGTDFVVERLADRVPTADHGLRLGIACLLEHIHTDSSVTACLDLYSKEEDSGLQGYWLQAILMNFSTEGIEPARQYILNTSKTPDVLEVREALLVACKMLGFEFPELAEWRADSQNDIEFRRAWYKDHALVRLADTFEIEHEEDSSWDEEVLEDDFGDEEPDTVIHHDQKVGRNDPCPCGSGKKYKKCCLNKQLPR